MMGAQQSSRLRPEPQGQSVMDLVLSLFEQDFTADFVSPAAKPIAQSSARG
jgi:hypothetical protein